MIIESIKGTVEDNVDVKDSIKLTIDEEATVFLLQSISESLYKNPWRAILQELGSNAADAHIRAKQTRPIEISLPSSLNPVLVIQDWGTGMSKADIRDTYSKVGASDKRGSNEERGGFGLGSKSPLAITPSFSLITIKNGEKHTIAVIRDEDGIPDFKFIGYEETDEPNGVTVCIPVADVDAMQAAAENLFISYPPGSILVNGQAPKYSLHNPTQFQRIGEHGWYALDEDAVEGFKGASAEILGVRYDITSELDGGVVSRIDGAKRIFLSLPNGQVKVETSREGIRAVSQSRETITRIAEAWVEEFRVQAAARIENSSRNEALLYHSSLPKFLQEELSTWHGEVIPTKGEVPFFPAQERPRLNEEGKATGEFIAVTPEDHLRYVRPPYLSEVAPRNTGTRYTARSIKHADTHDAPETLDELTVVYTLPDDYSKTISNAERDIRDYERWLRRAGVETVETTTRYITLGRPEDFSPWFRELAQFVPVQSIEEEAMEERREYRRDASARRSRSDYVKRAAREKRDYSVLQPALSSTSDRARLNTDSMDNSEMETFILGERVEIPEDATETQRALLENERVGGGGKMAYVLPDSQAATGTAADLVAKLADRGAHPGRLAAELALDVMKQVSRAGYRVIVLRASQKLEDLIQDAPGIRPLDEVVTELFESLVDEFEAADTSMALWTESKSQAVMMKLEPRLDELKDPIFREGGKRPSHSVEQFLAMLRKGARVSYWRGDKENFTTTVQQNVHTLGLTEDQRERVLAVHDYITELTIIERYPLLSGLERGDGRIKHAVLYVNAAYDQLLNVVE
jgi:hypothetical protein